MAERMFPEVPRLGDLGDEGIDARLRELGEAPEGASEPVIERPLVGAAPGSRGLVDAPLPWESPRAYKYTVHQFGYAAPLASGQSTSPIQPAGTIAADDALKGQKLVVRLDVLRTHEYPGWGEHQVLLTCRGLTQIAGVSEPVSFSRSYRTRDGGGSSATGDPIFVGLEAGVQGVSLTCSTVNVQSADDAAFLRLLEGDTFAKGLDLLSATQPVLKPFTELTLGLAKTLARRSKNFLVQDFPLGLDFDVPGGGARLRTGSYVAVQVPTATTIRWDEWMYAPGGGDVVLRADGATPLRYNYLVFRVSRM